MAVNHTNPLTQADLKNEHFGLEIEFYGMKRRKAAQVVADHFATTYKYIGGTYDKHRITDPKGRKWTVVFDSSINKSPNFYGQECELNTPVLTWEDIPNLLALIAKLEAAGAETDPAYCGIHVHIGDEEHTPTTLRNLVNLVNANEDLFTLALDINPRRRKKWCKPVDPYFLKSLNTYKPNTTADLARLWYDSEDWQVCAQTHYHDSRYRLLNLHSLFQGKGIEFRAFNATFDRNEILADIQLCMALSKRALNMKAASPDRPDTDNPKYTFRCLLLRIGMSGDDYKAARACLLRHLPGNAAWRRGDLH